MIHVFLLTSQRMAKTAKRDIDNGTFILYLGNSSLKLRLNIHSANSAYKGRFPYSGMDK